MAIYTQLSLIGTPGRRYSFSAKTAAVAEAATYGFKYNPFTGKLDYYLKDVALGANDSGGAGYRVLIVPNA